MGVVGVGLAMAGGSIPFVEAQFGVCGILPPMTSTQWQVSLFYTVPVSIVLLVLTAVTVIICRKVYLQGKKASKWMAGKSMSITKKVFWQSYWYVVAFYVTMPFVLLSFYLPYESTGDFWVFAVTAVLVPLQGMMNAFVYFQRNKGLIDIFSWTFGSCFKRCGKLCELKREEDEKNEDNETKQVRTAKLAGQGHPSRFASTNSSHINMESTEETGGTVQVDGVPPRIGGGNPVSHARAYLRASTTTTVDCYRKSELASSLELFREEMSPGKEGEDENDEKLLTSAGETDQDQSSSGESTDSSPEVSSQQEDDDDAALAAVLEYWKLNEEEESPPEQGFIRRRMTVA